MLRVRLSADTRRGRLDAQDAQRPEHPLLALQRVIGNHAVQRLLQRDFVRDLTPLGPATDWQSPANPVPQYAKLAKLANAKLRDAPGITEADINKALRAESGAKDIKPGLNFAGTISGAKPSGETGFLDADGVYRGAIMPVTLEGPLPKVAVMLGPEAFKRGPEWALGALRHELEHAAHMEMLIDKLAAWRADVKGGHAPKPANADAARAKFDQWVDKRKKRTDTVEYELLLGERQNSTKTTEFLAYIEGFMATFHLAPKTPDIKLLLADPYVTPIMQLWNGIEKGQKVDAAVRKAALARIRNYYDTVLTDDERGAFSDWMRFLIELGTEQPPSGDTGEAKARRLAHARFSQPHMLAFFKELKAMSRTGAFIRDKPGAPMNVDVKNEGTSAKTTKVGSGEVEIRFGAEYRLSIGDHKKAGVALTYKGPDAAEMRWLQFISREIVAEFPSGSGRPPKVRLEGEITRGRRTYKLTTDPKKSEWSTDTATGASAYYEQENSVVRTAGKLTLYDEPDARADLTKAVFEGEPKPKRVTSYARLVMYLVRSTGVVYRAEIDLEWKIASASDFPTPKPKVKSAGPVGSLSEAHRAKLLQQFPRVDYLQ